MDSISYYIELMMDKDLKKKWLEALRSGDYNQGTDWLHKVSEEGESSYCCLGVLAELVHGDIWEKYEDTTVLAMPGGQRSVLRREEMEEWGLRDETGACPLPGMNDGAGSWRGNPQSFEQIADWIEENL